MSLCALLYRTIGLLLVGLFTANGISASDTSKTATWAFENHQWVSPDQNHSPPNAFVLADHHVAKLPIVISDHASPPEVTAAQELASYLTKASGAQFSIIKESALAERSHGIFVGNTRASAEIIDPRHVLGTEEWVKQVDGSSLYLYGGFPRGTLYAVYHLLEDEIGVHWWTPTAETVPGRPLLAVSMEKRTGAPAFASRIVVNYYDKELMARDHFEGERLIPVKYDGGLFAARNRLNNEGNKRYRIRFEYGGNLGFGPPHLVHTYYLYIDPKTYFKTHPEWFSLINGKRQFEDAQLDVMNTELRTFFLSKLESNIRETMREDALQGYSSRLIFDISANDSEGYDQGAASTKLIQQQGTQMAPLLDFVNYLAAAIQKEFPKIMLRTMAYKGTQDPTKSMKAADNVIVTLTDTESNPTRPLTADAKNQRFLALLKQWSSQTKHLWIWDYANAYGIFEGSLPVPFAQSMYSDFKSYRDLGVQGMLVEIGDPWSGDNRDFLYWSTVKGLENPNQPFDLLEKTFTDGYFGPAGTYLRQYYAQLSNVAGSSKGDHVIAFGSHLPDFAYLNLDFLVGANKLFDSAELSVTEVTNDPIALLRVRKARVSLDEAVLRRYYLWLLPEWIERGGTETNFPIDLTQVKERYRKTLDQIIDNEVLPENNSEWKQRVEDRLILFTPHDRLPLDLKTADSNRVFDYLPDQMAWNSAIGSEQTPIVDSLSGRQLRSRPVVDERADAGVAFEFQTTIPSDKSTTKPVEYAPLWSYLGQSDTRLVKEGIPLQTISDEYAWIKLGSFTTVRRGLASLFCTTENPVGSIYIDSDYYPGLFSEGKETQCDFWVKIRHVSKDGMPFCYRISRMVIVKND